MTDAGACHAPLVDEVAAAVRGGVDWVQIRDRELSARALLELLDSLREACGDRQPLWIVNRRVDVGLAGDADGVHLGFDAMAPEEARSLLGPGRWIGASTHDPRELADEPFRLALTYAHLAPVFLPLSKVSEREPIGLAALKRAASFGLPVFAQGGVCAANARACIDAGASGVAVTGEILGAEDPEAAARTLRQILGS